MLESAVIRCQVQVSKGFQFGGGEGVQLPLLEVAVLAVGSPHLLGSMRHPQDGGLSDERRAFRERIRREAAEMFGADQANTAVAKQLRVTVRSVQRWRCSWHESGDQGLQSKGSPGRPTLSTTLFTVLEQELAQGRSHTAGRTGP